MQQQNRPVPYPRASCPATPAPSKVRLSDLVLGEAGYAHRSRQSWPTFVMVPGAFGHASLQRRKNKNRQQMM